MPDCTRVRRMLNLNADFTKSKPVQVKDTLPGPFLALLSATSNANFYVNLLNIVFQHAAQATITVLL